MDETLHHHWTPFKLFQDSNEIKLVLVILNHTTVSWTTLENLWKKAVLKIAVDGGSNHLYNVCATKKCQENYLPDIISGDMDSALPEVLNFYKTKGVEIIETPDQNNTDFTKALQIVISRLQKTEVVNAVAVLADLGAGRLDHLFGIINTLHLTHRLCPAPIYIIGDSTITWLLGAGKHDIHITDEVQQSACGLIPVGEPCQHVTTTGLKWNLVDQKLQFGKLVSTSNTFVSSKVTVSTDNNLLFTMDNLPPENHK